MTTRTARSHDAWRALRVPISVQRLQQNLVVKAGHGARTSAGRWWQGVEA